MRRDVMAILVCPVCKGELQLSVDEENETEIISGSLVCAHCNQRYPIDDAIPNLLPPNIRTQSA